MYNNYARRNNICEVSPINPRTLLGPPWPPNGRQEIFSKPNLCERYHKINLSYARWGWVTLLRLCHWNSIRKCVCSNSSGTCISKIIQIPSLQLSWCSYQALSSLDLICFLVSAPIHNDIPLLTRLLMPLLSHPLGKLPWPSFHRKKFHTLENAKSLPSIGIASSRERKRAMKRFGQV